MFFKRIVVCLLVAVFLLSGTCAASAEDNPACVAVLHCFQAAETLRQGMALAEFDAALADRDIRYESRIASEGSVSYAFLPCLTLNVIGDPIVSATIQTVCTEHQADIRMSLVLMHEGGMEQYSAAMRATDHTSVSADMADCTAWLDANGLTNCFGQPHPNADEVQRTLADYLACCAMLTPGLPRTDVLAMLEDWTSVNGGRCLRVGYENVSPDEHSMYRLNSLPMHQCADLALGLVFEDGRLISCQIMTHLYGQERTLSGMVTVCSDVDWDAAQ